MRRDPTTKEMAMGAKKDEKKPAGRASARGANAERFSDEERAAMQERAQELRKETRRGSRSKKPDGERDVLDKIAEMADDDRAMAERLHALITEAAPNLSPKTWYGMPAYANADGKAVCFFQAASKFKSRYATLGFNDVAMLDDGAMWPTAFALAHLTPEAEERIAELVQRAAG
jgi:uncharacterized protein YdhG (YjbR/CyaY superfamily)